MTPRDVYYQRLMQHQFLCGARNAVQSRDRQVRALSRTFGQRFRERLLGRLGGQSR